MRNYTAKLFFILLIFNVLAIEDAFSQATKLEQVINQLEKQRFEAQVKKDTAFLQKVLADDLVYVHSSAIRENKKVFIDNIASGKAVYQSIEIEKSELRVYQNTVIVNGLGKFTVWIQDKPQTITLIYTDVYAKRKGKWQMVSWQSTRVPQ